MLDVLMFRPALPILLLCYLSAPCLADGESFLQEALGAKNDSRWEELEAISRTELGQEPDNAIARAFLAHALAGRKEFSACVQELLAYELGGRVVDRSLRGYGVPLDEVIATIYGHCWANWSPDFNRSCWKELFAAFADRRTIVKPASRLLMAALKLRDEEEILRLEEFFESRLDPETRRGGDKVEFYFAQAYLRAEIRSERSFDLAKGVFERAWNDAAEKEGFQGPESEAGLDLEKRESCDLDSDQELNLLALASVLNSKYDPEENPLAAREVDPGVVFDDETLSVGLKDVFANRVAVGDFDEDGFEDLCFSGRLFRNVNGKRFVDVTKEKGLRGRGASALFGDFDNDGSLDLLLPSAPHPRLFRNKGKKSGFVFEDVTVASGLFGLRVEKTPEGAAWTDVDGDGWLDFYLAVYEGPMSVGHSDLLVRNNGDGTFSDISEKSGIGAADGLCGRGVNPCDFDRDGDADLYVSNYRLQPNFLFVNDGNGVFADLALSLELQGVAQQKVFGHTIGSCWGDIDNDGDFDLFTANLAHPRFVRQGFSNLSMLYLNSGFEGGYTFTECRRDRGIRFQETHSDPALIDFDNDGDLDLSITCVYEGVPSALFQNDGEGYFSPVTFRSRLVAFHGWGQAWFDADNDGDLDCLIASSSGCRFFRNRGNENHWLALNLRGKRHNKNGVGAIVEVTTKEGDASRTLVRELVGGRGTTSQDGFRVHFGLGSYRGRVRVAVTWPGTGQTETKNVSCDRIVTFRQVRLGRARKPQRSRKTTGMDSGQTRGLGIRGLRGVSRSRGRGATLGRFQGL